MPAKKHAADKNEPSATEMVRQELQAIAEHFRDELGDHDRSKEFTGLGKPRFEQATIAKYVYSKHQAHWETIGKIRMVLGKQWVARLKSFSKATPALRI